MHSLGLHMATPGAAGGAVAFRSRMGDIYLKVDISVVASFFSLISRLLHVSQASLSMGSFFPAVMPRTYWMVVNAPDLRSLDACF